ncbi:membrane-bound lytic murein transglycosylase F [Lachnospiraceae bacterium]|nr:membrane-bound lytic murein transglycosylase F [Lachnospiraceae bacterium]
MIDVSALDALRAALSSSGTVSRQPTSNADFSSFLKTDKNLEEIYAEASQTYGVSIDLLKAMTKQESNFDPNATSRSGAQGLMQLMPATAAGLGVTDAYDPYQNVMGGAKYIRQMLDKYNGNVSLALAAYNAGSNNVDKYGGIPPFAETQNYVAKITQYLNEGVTVPDSQSAAGGVSNGSGINYQDLNNLAKEILTEIFAYDDYINYLSSLMNQEAEPPTLSMSVTSTSSEEETAEENASAPDSYIAYEHMTNASGKSLPIV